MQLHCVESRSSISSYLTLDVSDFGLHQQHTETCSLVKVCDKVVPLPEYRAMKSISASPPPLEPQISYCLQSVSSICTVNVTNACQTVAFNSCSECDFWIFTTFILCRWKIQGIRRTRYCSSPYRTSHFHWCGTLILLEDDTAQYPLNLWHWTLFQDIQLRAWTYCVLGTKLFPFC